MRVVKQAGRALAQRPMVPPDPIFDSPTFLDRPVKTRHLTRRNGVKLWEVTWTYIMAVADDDTIDYAAAEAWPATPTFT